METSHDPTTRMEIRTDAEAREKVHALIRKAKFALMAPYDIAGNAHSRPMVLTAASRSALKAPRLELFRDLRRSRMDAAERLGHVGEEVWPGAGAGDARAPDQDVVPPGLPGLRKEVPRRFAKPALRPVARHGVPDLAGTGHAEANALCAGFRGVAPASLEKESRCRMATRARGPEVIRTQRQPVDRQAQSTLRPRARRAFSTLRPPLVAMRARKPCRRLRTRLLG